MNSFDRKISDGAVTLKKADKDKGSLLVEIMSFKSQLKLQNLEKKQKKNIFLRTHIHFLMVEKEFLMLLTAKYF